MYDAAAMGRKLVAGAPVSIRRASARVSGGYRPIVAGRTLALAESRPIAWGGRRDRDVARA
jgi:hypothetical protein